VEGALWDTIEPCGVGVSLKTCREAFGDGLLRQNA